VEIEKGNTITRTTADAFNQIIADMESFADIAENTMEKANSQAEFPTASLYSCHFSRITVSK